MTGPDARLSAELDVDTSKVSDKVGDGLDEAGRKNERKARELGESLGEEISRGIESEMNQTGVHIGDSLSASIRSAGVGGKVSKATFQTDDQGNVVKAWVTVAAANMAREVTSGKGLSLFKEVGDLIGQAVGSGFNVSGRSKLIILLIPILGAIVYLVLALVQAAGALVAYLYLIPSLLGAIILQAGILFIAFQGVGTAIQGAFEAKNAEELNEALKGLTPAAQDFVRSLLPLRDLFNEVKKVVQEKFFAALAGSITALIEGIKKIGSGPLGAVAGALGGFFNIVISFLNNPAFQQFIQKLIPATVTWIEGFSAAMLSLLTGLANLGTGLMPFLNAFGTGFNSLITDFGEWLGSLATDPEFLQFLDDAQVTMKDFGEALLAALVFLKDFWQAFKGAGGDRTIQGLTDAFKELSDFLNTPEGYKSMEGLLHLVEALSIVFFTMIQMVFLALYAGEELLEWIRYDAIPAIGEFLGMLGRFFADLWQGIVDIGIAIANWYMGIAHWFEEIANDITGFFETIRREIVGSSHQILSSITAAFENALTFLRSLPGRAISALASLGSALIESGRQLINGLIEGIKQGLGPLGGIMNTVGSVISRFLPFSPAKEGPLSGKGDPLKSGQEIVNRLAAGIMMETPTLAAASSVATSNIFFGPNSIQVGFSGQLPTSSQASITGRAVASGISGQLARDTRLAVRTL